VKPPDAEDPRTTPAPPASGRGVGLLGDRGCLHRPGEGRRTPDGLDRHRSHHHPGEGLRHMPGPSSSAPPSQRGLTPDAWTVTVLARRMPHGLGHHRSHHGPARACATWSRPSPPAPLRDLGACSTVAGWPPRRRRACPARAALEAPEVPEVNSNSPTATRPIRPQTPRPAEEAENAGNARPIANPSPLHPGKERSNEPPRSPGRLLGTQSRLSQAGDLGRLPRRTQRL
jgi:hypothetical protein